MSHESQEFKNIIEAALYAADEPLSISALRELFPESAAPTPQDIEGAIEQLAADCQGRGVELSRVGRGYRFQSREKYSPWLRQLYQGRPPRYSRAALETLAIIAYRQPVTRGDIEDIRGVSVSSDTLRTLLNRDWIKQVGHRDVPGRPALFATTRGFLEYFNLRSLSELPPLLEQRDIGEIASELNLPLELVEGRPDAAAQDATDEASMAAAQTPPRTTAQIIPLETAADPEPAVDGETA